LTFIWPELLWALLLVPALIGLYLHILRRKKKVALRYSALVLATGLTGARSAARRHLPPILFLLAIISMIVAMARPAAVVMVPSHQKTVMLAIDVSGSMRATDVQPNRLVAAQAAARTSWKSSRAVLAWASSLSPQRPS
jgi:Ca-activated chloride channel family protein